MEKMMNEAWLVKCHNALDAGFGYDSGPFTVNNKDGTITIHDWYDYSGQLGDKRIESREKERDRKAKYRARKKAEAEAGRDDEGSPAPVPQKKDDCPDFVPRDSPAKTGTVPPLQYRTGQDSTGQDTTVQGQDRRTPPIPPASGGKVSTQNPPDLQHQRFTEFWTAYPKKKSMGTAEKAWMKIKPNAQLHERIIAAIRANIATNPDWQRDGGQYIEKQTAEQEVRISKRDEEMKALKHSLDEVKDRMEKLESKQLDTVEQLTRMDTKLDILIKERSK